MEARILNTEYSTEYCLSVEVLCDVYSTLLALQQTVERLKACCGAVGAGTAGSVQFSARR